MDSLQLMCLNYVVKNLRYYQYDFDSTIKLLPPCVKDQLLHRFTIFPSFWKGLCLKNVLQSLIHSNTPRIDLCLASVDDDVLNILKNSYNLKDIRLTGIVKNSITSAGLLSLVPYIRSLYMLQLPNCDAVDDAFLISVAHNCPRLAALNVDGCANITDLALEALSTLQNLQWVKLSETKITTKGVEKLITGVSGVKLKELRLANCQLVTSAVLNIIVQFCPSIEVLVFYNTPINEEDLGNLQFTKEGNLKNLKQLTWTIQ